MPNNTLFAVEGIDGCGKTTLVNAVAAALHAKGYQVSTTQEPWAEPIDPSLDPMEQVLRISIDRLHHCRAIAATPGIVLTDRFFLSTMAYQGTLYSDERKNSSLRRMIHAINQQIAGTVRLSKIFWLSLPVDAAMERKPCEYSRERLQQIADIYAEEFGMAPWSYYQLGGREPVEYLTKQVVRQIELRLQYDDGSMPDWVYRADKEKTTWDTVKPISGA